MKAAEIARHLILVIFRSGSLIEMNKRYSSGIKVRELYLFQKSRKSIFHPRTKIAGSRSGALPLFAKVMAG